MYNDKMGKCISKGEIKTIHVKTNGQYGRKK
jgi:hypothetical protein